MPKDDFFDISQLPSLKGKNPMTIEEEALTRRKTCRFIVEAGRQLKLPRIAVATAQVFFHRFYAKHSFRDHGRFEVAVAAILLAGKAEETPRKLTTGKFRRGTQWPKLLTETGGDDPANNC